MTVATGAGKSPEDLAIRVVRDCQAELRGLPYESRLKIRFVIEKAIEDAVKASILASLPVVGGGFKGAQPHDP